MQGGGEMVFGGPVATGSATQVTKSIEGDSKSDFSMFKEWAIRNKKEYKTIEDLCQCFKIWRSTKEQIDAKNSLELKLAFDNWAADHKRNYGSELEREIGFKNYRTNTSWINSSINENPGLQFPSGTLMLDQGLSICELNSLLKKPPQNDRKSISDFEMFKEWAKKTNKVYETAEEENKRFKIWCSTKERTDEKNSRRQPGGVTYGLTFFADLTEEERGRFYMRFPGNPFDVPREKRRQAPKIRKSRWEKKKTDERAEFDKWAAEHKRNYGSEVERTLAYAKYKIITGWIESLRKEDPGKYSTSPIELGILLDQNLTLSDVKNLLSGCYAPHLWTDFNASIIPPM